MLPFTRAQFFEAFAAYNSAHWPAAIAAYPLALAALLLALRRTPRAGQWAGTALALMWGWVGFVYHGIYFSRINPIAAVFAAAFVAQAVLFLVHAALDRGFEVRPASRPRAVAGALLACYALLAYPLTGLLAGDRFPAMPLFGITPCPLLIFTFGLLILASRARWWLWVIPLLWSAIGGSAALLLSVPQDWALPVSAALALLIVFLDGRRHESGA